MTKLKLLGGAIILLTSVVWGTATAFSEGDIIGTYSFNLQGTVTVPDASGQPQPVPTTSIGRFEANGSGGVTAVEAVQNLGGLAIIPFALVPGTSATYSVNADTGLGVITVQVQALQTPPPEFPLGPGAVPPTVDLTGVVEYVLNFVLVDNDNLEVIGTKISSVDGAGNKTPLGALVISGSATKQAPDSTQ